YGAHRLWHQPRPQYRFTVPMIDYAYKSGLNPLLSPDGSTLYFIGFGAGGRPQVFRRRLDDLSATPIAGTENISTIADAVTPDGRHLIVQFAGAVFKRISVDGGPLEMLADGVEGGFGPNSGLTINPEGTILLGGGPGIRRLLANGNVEWLLKSAPNEL